MALRLTDRQRYITIISLIVLVFLSIIVVNLVASLDTRKTAQVIERVVVPVCASPHSVRCQAEVVPNIFKQATPAETAKYEQLLSARKRQLQP